MTPTETTSTLTITPEQVFEIQAMAEGGQFADALIRLRKVKSYYPQVTQFIALEKQLERLLVLPRDSEPSDPQRKELLDSLPGLMQGVVRAVRSMPPSRPTTPPPTPRVQPERTDREAARAQLKEQYFQHADEYLKKGAYGSALVEIRRVKIIAPDDQVALEYERTIRQLVELQQRSGSRTEVSAVRAETDAPTAPAGQSVRTFGDEQSDAPAPAPAPAPSVPDADESEPSPRPRRDKRWLFGGLALAVLCGGGAVAFMLGTPEEPVAEEPPAQSTPIVEQQAPAPRPGHAIPYELDPEFAQTETVPENRTRQKAVPKTDQTSGVQRQNTAPISEPTNAAPTERKVGGEEPVQEIRGGAAPVEQAGTVRDPQLVRFEKPVFPPEVKGTPGGDDVVISVLVDASGKPVRTVIAQSTNEALNTSLIAAAMKSTYTPGTSSNGPAAKWVTLPLRIR
ncbi:MAG TPA: energy transducer TonB [Bacteroidota bacterium]|nr:energy transducer TonB [Bacteroidota bacterium]